MESDCKEWLSKCENAFRTSLQHEYKGIEGVVVFDSKISGPTVGISVCTHGNEPVGLAIIHHLFENPDIISQGKLTITVNNIEATKNFFNKDVDCKEVCRAIDCNMNRLPFPLEGKCYEVKRAKQLVPIWSEFIDGGLDIHSTSSAAPSMLIVRNEFLDIDSNRSILNVLTIKHVISNILEQFRGTPVINYFGNEDSFSDILIECGKHCESNTFENAISYALSWLSAYGMVEYKSECKPCEKEYFKVIKPIRLPDDNIEYFYPEGENIKAFQRLGIGKILAVSKDGKEFFSDHDGYAIMAPETKKAIPKNESFFYLADKL